MPRPISRPLHGLIDYNYIAVVRSAPQLFGFEDEEKAALMCRVLTGTVLLYSVFTRAEWGFFKVIPYKTHLALDTAGSLLTLAAPWLAGFSGNARARNAFLLFGIFGLMAKNLSEPQEMEAPEKQGEEAPA